MLDFIRVLKSAKAHERDELIPLTTPWGEALDPERVLPEHPRPALQRAGYTMLNGWWDYAIVPAPRRSNTPETNDASAPLPASEAIKTISQAAQPHAWDGHILVPFSPEAPLSGVKRQLRPNELLWYRRDVELPETTPGERFILHLEAVDWICAVYVNDRLVATHQGGYLPFDIDITEAAEFPAGVSAAPAGANSATYNAAARIATLAVCVYDPSDAGTQLRGKQRLHPGGIWYTAQSGIWQSVWLEVVPAAHISALALQGAADGTLTVDATVIDTTHDALDERDAALRLTLQTPDGTAIAQGTLPLAALSDVASSPTENLLYIEDSHGKPRGAMPSTRPRRYRIFGTLHVDGPRLWSPDDPYLYDVRAELLPRAGATAIDTARSYCAFRTVAIQKDADGLPRFFLNGEPLVIKGVLDQGYWPDGLMTAPADETLAHDIVSMRAAGFNMLRKHIKIESRRWYYHCDRLGMLVWQDAVSGGGAYSPWHTSRKPTLFQASWNRFRDDTPRHRAALSSDDAAYRDEWTTSCREMIRLLAGHPSIVTWVLFNEGWGQFDARQACTMVRELDPTRPIDATSGWYDQRCGDYLSHHNYFRPLAAVRDTEGRAFVLSEFGGLTQLVPDHSASPIGYGYGNYPSIEAWREAVERELAQVDYLARAGLAGSVYTQLSDVEDELNGILTYDRRVNKLRRDGHTA